MGVGRHFTVNPFYAFWKCKLITNQKINASSGDCKSPSEGSDMWVRTAADDWWHVEGRERRNLATVPGFWLVQLSSLWCHSPVLGIWGEDKKKTSSFLYLLYLRICSRPFGYVRQRLNRGPCLGCNWSQEVNRIVREGSSSEKMLQLSTSIKKIAREVGEDPTEQNHRKCGWKRRLNEN